MDTEETMDTEEKHSSSFEQEVNQKEVEKCDLMFEMWPEWNWYSFDQEYLNSDEESPAMIHGMKQLFYPCDVQIAEGFERQILVCENVNQVMYASKDQFVYSEKIENVLLPLQMPYCGKIAGFIEEGTPVYVTWSVCNTSRPQDGKFYFIDGTVGDPFLQEYIEKVTGEDEQEDLQRAIGIVFELSEEPAKGEKDALEVTEKVWPASKSWMEEVWSNWQEAKCYEGNKYSCLVKENDSSVLLPVRDFLLGKYYPEEDYRALFYPERYEDAVMVQKEKTDVIMYATERQLVYAEIMPTVKGPLKAPYYGPVVGALEKGEPVRVVSVIENQQRPEDGEYYGIAIDLELGSTPFLSEYMDPFVERFGADAFGSNSAAYGYAVKLSSTPPGE